MGSSEQKGCGALVSAATLIRTLPRGDEIDIKPVELPYEMPTQGIEAILHLTAVLQRDAPWAPRLMRWAADPQGKQLRLGVQTCQPSANFFVSPSANEHFFTANGRYDLLHVRHASSGELTIGRSCVCHHGEIPSPDVMRNAFLSALDTAIMLSV